MKRFLSQLLIFTIFPIMYFGVIHLINRATYSKQSVNLQNSSLLIIGDSHPLRSLNPYRFESALNISQFSEPYVITYWKLKKILETNQVDSILMGFAPHNISAFNDYKFVDSKWSYGMFKKTYPIGNFRKLGQNIELDYNTYYKVLFRETCLYPKNNHINYIGKYGNTKKSNISNWEAPIKRHFYRDGRDLGISNVAIQYLDSIVVLCKRNEIFLGLVNTPVHNSYIEKIPFTTLNRYNELKSNYIKNNVFVFDKAENNYPDTFFHNPDHTNFYGAERFTNELIEILNTNAQQSANRQ